MSFLNDCFNTMLEYGEAIKSSFVKGHVSDWPEAEEVVEETPAVPEDEGTTEPENEEVVIPEDEEVTEPENTEE